MFFLHFLPYPRFHVCFGGLNSDALRCFTIYTLLAPLGARSSKAVYACGTGHTFFQTFSISEFKLMVFVPSGFSHGPHFFSPAFAVLWDQLLFLCKSVNCDSWLDPSPSCGKQTRKEGGEESKREWVCNTPWMNQIFLLEYFFCPQNITTRARKNYVFHNCVPPGITPSSR